MIISNTKIYKNFQTSIPKEVREAFGVDKDIEMIVKDLEQRFMNRRIAK